MNYTLIKDLIGLAEDFQNKNEDYPDTIQGFKQWIAKEHSNGGGAITEPNWEGKENGRSAESMISTLIIHMNRYARSYSKSAIFGSDFSTQEEFIFLINLKAFGPMTKMELIKKNIQEKPVGMQTINRLIKQGWVEQTDSLQDKRSKVICITDEGMKTLDQQMSAIRKATQIVTGNLNQKEKMDLIRLLDKLHQFHHAIYAKNINSAQLINTAFDEYNLQKK